MRRIFIVVILLLVVGGIAAFVILRNQGGVAPVPGGTPVVQNNNPAATAAPTSTPAPTAEPTIEIVVALQKINRGQRITPDVIVVRAWPENSAPLSAIVDPELVIGMIARTDIERESPIKNTDLALDLANLASVGSDASAVMPPGTRMIAVPFSNLTSNGYVFQPGDRVDIVMSALFVDLDEDFQSILPNDIQFMVLTSEGFTLAQPVDGRFDTIPFSYTLGDQLQSAFPVIIRPSEKARPRLVTQMAVQDALVIHVGNFPEDGRLFVPGSANPASAPDGASEATATPAAAQTTGTPVVEVPFFVSIAVSPQEALVLSYFIQANVPINFLLRPANETGLATVQQVDLDYVMNAYRITVPRKLPYGLEPAIRSIRQIILSQDIPLSNDTP